MSQPRRKSVPVSIGPVRVGGRHPIVVQSMTNTDTADVEGTAQQVKSLARAGSELVRVTVNTAEAPLKVTAVAPVKFAPLMVTLAPTAPLAGESDCSAAGWRRS